MQALKLNILGFPAVNHELEVEVRDPSTGTVVKTARPFLDGTVSIPQILPGAYDVAIRHPNLALPVLRQQIRVLPVGDTKISLLLDPSRFRDTPIADIPDANLGPVRDATTTVEQTVQPLATKRPGEAITAADWNTLAGNLGALANAVTQLTRLVTPTGHDHGELENKINEIQGNFTALLDTLTTAFTELQRQIQAERIRKQVDELVDRAGLPADNPRRTALLDAVAQLNQGVVAPPSRFAQVSRNTGVQLESLVQQILDEQAEDPDLPTSPQVKAIGQSADLLRGTNTTSYETELRHLRKSDLTFGVGGLTSVLDGGRT
ncbi:hypothetical protein [Actinomadura sp. HBU206391]|uniref:hypothetical protein n=1 Tax=Actinomadura sp. HBU206391 TaxID=2731692 RepID=UPI00164EECEA|nr:hypothetical protein [Actinomadura sp. HBU206391]MBC6462879.1 hypothetical protein [Actinomadura sp. HBU206391]